MARIGQLSLLLLQLSLHWDCAHGFIKRDANGRLNYTYFRPYDKGFVGVYGDPSNFLRERINEGSFENPEKELIYDQAVPTQSCPGMVGPFSDGNYFCTAKEYGYCDRRSGVCFCSIGYQGIDCSECTPSYFMIGNLCYPKKLCPNDCSNSGTCDYVTGTCQCFPSRVGVDCSELLCQAIDILCEACSSIQNKCLRCQAGYYLSATGSCSSCYDFDPRCAGCTLDEGCTLCSDPLLTSVHRSGYRAQDPPLPIEEADREFSITLPFGTKSPESFADTEAYIVVTTPDKPLYNATTTCDQGYSNDDSWTCQPKVATHIVCGHKGVFSFTYPNYVTNETSRFFRVSVIRTGGGYGTVSISYFIKHYTTDDNDLTATAPYTTSQTLLFEDGIVERSFLVAILDDNVVEENEVFQIVLELPEGGGSLGAQFRTNVTIIDDDYHRLSPAFTHSIWDHVVISASQPFFFLVQSVLASGQEAVTGGERFSVVVENDISLWLSETQRHNPRYFARVSDNHNGTYSVTGAITNQGRYNIHIYHAFPNGLKGTYYSDAFAETVALERIDRLVNFTWGTGRLTPRGADYISVRWTGVVRPDTTDTYLFLVDADDHVRLWIDGTLLIDHWHEQQAYLEPYRSIDFNAGSFYEIILEYREVRGEAYAHLLWTTLTTFTDLGKIGVSGMTSFQAIPPENLYSLYEVGNSPIELIITSSDTSPKDTECSGDGIVSARVGMRSSFQFCPRDVYGNYRDDVDEFFLSSQLFSSVMHLTDSQGHEGYGRDVLHPILTFDHSTHCWDGEYTPDRAGLYNLSITYQVWHNETRSHIAGSPFVVSISPGPLSGPHSDILDIPAPPFETVAGTCTNFTVVARDQFSNLLLHGGDSIEVYLYRVSFFLDESEETSSSETHSPPELVRYGTIFDHQTGKYTATICPVSTGWYELHVLSNGFGISNIPFQVEDRQSSQGIPQGLQPGSSCRGQYIASSPYHLFTQHGAISPYRSTVEVLGNLNGGVVGELSFTIITLRDSWDNVIRTLPSASVVSLQLLLSPSVQANVANLWNGSVYLEYLPERTGENLVEITVNDQPIHGSPFSVMVTEGRVSATYSYAIGEGLHVGFTDQVSSFLVYSFDLDGNRKHTITETFLLQTNGTETISSRLRNCKLTEEDAIIELPEQTAERRLYCLTEFDSGGVYYALFAPTVTGELTISVFLQEDDDSGTGSSRLVEVSNSPFIARIHSASPVAENSDTLGALEAVTVGETNYVFVSLRDTYGNLLESGGNSLEMAIYGVSGNWGTEVPLQSLFWLPDSYHYSGFYGPYPTLYGQWIDHQDGRYSASYSLQTTGCYVMRLSVLEPGLNATYFNDTTFGYLSVRDSNLPSFQDSLGGAAVNSGSSISWTGDIGGSPGDGVLGEGTYFHRYHSQTESEIYFDSREVTDFTIWNITRNQTTRSSSFTKSYRLANTRFPSSSPSAPPAKYRESYWSVRYTGVLYPEHAETYTFTLFTDPEATASLRIGGVGLHTNQTSLGDLVVQSSQSSEKASGQFRFSDLRSQGLLLLYQHYSGTDTFLKLYWESPSTPYAIVPPSAYAHWRNISHFNVTASPAALSSSASTAVGDALTSASVGELHSFLVYARDRFGNLLQRGGDSPSMMAVGPDGVAFRGEVTDYGNSTYLVSYLPTMAGVHRMYITMGCCRPSAMVGVAREIELTRSLAIQSSPFLLTISPAPLSPPHCVATGHALLSGVAGETGSFVVLFRDRLRNPTTAPSSAATAPLSVMLLLKSQETGDLVLNQEINWLHRTAHNLTVAYNVTKAGSYLLHLRLNDQSILGSPFALRISPAEPAPSRTVVRGNGKRVSSVDSKASFEVLLHDRFDNLVTVPGEKLFTRLVGNQRREEEAERFLIPACVDQLNGRYLCEYIPKTPGDYLLSIALLKRGAGRPPGGTGLALSVFSTASLSFSSSSMTAIPPLPAIPPAVFSVNEVATDSLDLVLQRTVPAIDFSFPSGFQLSINPLTDRLPPNSSMDPSFLSHRLTGRDFSSGVSLVWEGFLLAPYSDTFQFSTRASRWNVSVYLDSQLLFDTAVPQTTMTRSGAAASLLLMYADYRPTGPGVALVKNSMYELRVEARASPESLVESSELKLLWSSTSTREAVVPSFFLYEQADNVAFSPFPVTVSEA
jgi:hypothetical protein